jgi:predicted short-subunit dehydrogenase-like oxidoreductase (DUF2520 family)
MATATLVPLGRGRPTVATLSQSLDGARRVNANLRDEVRALRHEGAAFAVDVRAHAYRVYLAAQSDRPDLALHEAGAIVMAADRHLRQRGGTA